MARIQQDSFSDTRYFKKKVQMTNDDFIQLDKELEEHKVTKYSNYWKKDITYIDTSAWFEKRGATKKNAVVISNYNPAVYDGKGGIITPTDCSPILYEELNSMLEQYYWWKGKKEYAKNSELKELDKVARTMTVEN